MQHPFDKSGDREMGKAVNQEREQGFTCLDLSILQMLLPSRVASLALFGR